MNLGRIPLGRKVPTTLPLGPTPRLTKPNISCMLMISFSMPVISETLHHAPASVAHREICTTIAIAGAIC